MQILVLLGMYFDAVVVFVTSKTLLFRLALAILCLESFRFFKGPLFRKPVTGQELFLLFLKTGSKRLTCTWSNILIKTKYS